MLDIFETLFQTLRGQLVNIPTNNFIGTLYVILNAILLVLGLTQDTDA